MAFAVDKAKSGRVSDREGCHAPPLCLVNEGVQDGFVSFTNVHFNSEPSRCSSWRHIYSANAATIPFFMGFHLNLRHGCTSARRGQHDYWAHLGADKDGNSCESYVPRLSICSRMTNCMHNKHLYCGPQCCSFSLGMELNTSEWTAQWARQAYLTVQRYTRPPRLF